MFRVLYVILNINSQTVLMHCGAGRQLKPALVSRRRFPGIGFPALVFQRWFPGVGFAALVSLRWFPALVSRVGFPELVSQRWFKWA